MKCNRCNGSGSEPNDVKIGKTLKAFREKAGVSLRSTARTMDISPSYLVNLEQGTRRWNGDLIALYHKAVRL